MAWVNTKNHLILNMILITLGVIQAYALASPFSGETQAWLQVVAMTAFLLIQEKSNSTKQSFWQSWVFVTSWLIASVWWLYISIHHFGGLPIVLTLAAIALLCGSLAVYYAFTVSIYLSFRTKHKTWVRAGFFASCWTLAELARAEFFTGFPWGAIGYAHIDSILVQSAPWVGVYGVGWIAAYFSTCLAQGVIEMRKTTGQQTYIYAASMLLGLGVLVIPWKISNTSNGSALSVSLLQGNIPQDLKYTERRQQAVQWYVDNAIQAKTDIVVLPETAIPYLPKDMPKAQWDKLKTHFENGKQAVIVGIPTYEVAKGYGNSAIAISAETQNYVYHKHHLVPFGEFVPSYFQWFNAMVNFGITDFIRGPLKPQPLSWRDQQIAIQICYEDLFGEELAHRFTLDKDLMPTVLVNLSNIAWFGHTVVIPQHVHIARMRSIELNRPTVRATNSGGTAIIDSSGKVQAIAEPYTQAVLVGQVPASDGRVTWFAQWAGRWGLMPLWIACLLMVLLPLGIAWGKKRHAQSH
jgi:apolipoprotein N-acyltransferase